MAKKTAVIYARFSCSKQREASIDDQLKECRRWCETNGYSVIAEYCDHAISGRTDDRPQFQEMIANAGESDVVVVYMMDRFSRDVYDATIYKKRLKDASVAVVSATQQLPDGPESRLIESIYEAMAEIESVNIARRVRRGMTGNAEKCMHNGIRVFGYDWGEDGRYVVNEGEAVLVRDAFDMRAAGESSVTIARYLAERGVVSKNGRPCGKAMVRSMMANEKYVGTYQWGDVRIDGGMPAIVDRDTFALAQVARRPRKPEKRHHFALSGKVLCMTCGRNMHGTSSTNHCGVSYHYHRCGCNHLRSDWLESEVAGSVRALLGDHDLAMEIATAIAGHADDGSAEARVDAARKSLEGANRGISNIMRAVEAGMDYAEVAGRLDELTAQRREAEEELRTWSGRGGIDVEGLAEFLTKGAGMTDAELLDAFVWQVQVYDDDISVVLAYDAYGEPIRANVPRMCADVSLGLPNHIPREHVLLRYDDGMLAVSFARKRRRT